MASGASELHADDGAVVTMADLVRVQDPAVQRAVLPQSLQTDLFARLHALGAASSGGAALRAGGDAASDSEDSDDTDFYAGVRVCEDVPLPRDEGDAEGNNEEEGEEDLMSVDAAV